MTIGISLRALNAVRDPAPQARNPFAAWQVAVANETSVKELNQ